MTAERMAGASLESATIPEDRESMIPGVYNYCDDWCECCPVTGRCRSYAMRQSFESRFGKDPEDASASTDMVTFTRELARADGLATPGLDASLAGDPDGEFALAPADEPLAQRALAYAVASELLLAKVRWRPPGDTLQLGTTPPPHNVIMWYHLFLAMKTRRALVSAHRAERGRPYALEDALGSAKIALISIDRSRAALKEVANGPVRGLARQLIVMLDLVRVGLEARVPGARSFIRPGLDAPAP